MIQKKILIFNWKCIKHPQAGGAEIVTHEIAKRMVQAGDEVTMIVARPQKNGTLMPSEEIIDGIQIIRVGGRFSHYWHAYQYYKKNSQQKGMKFFDIDFVIEEVNTLPYFARFYTKNIKHFYFYHQLAKEVWFYQMPPVIAHIGYVLEKIYTKFLAKFSGKNLEKNVITISNSTKQDLISYGFPEKNIQIIREGIMNTPLEKIDFSKKEQKFSVLFHSALREMKRPDHAVESFCLFLQKLSKDEQKNVQMWVSGGGPLKKKCAEIIQKYSAEDSVTLFGRTTDKQMYDLMQRASCLVATSVKEGWGLIVTEANSFGTPAISYDVDGLRDSTALGGGIISAPTPKKMADKIFEMYEIFQKNPEKFQKMCITALESTRDITFEHCYEDFQKIISQ